MDRKSGILTRLDSGGGCVSLGKDYGSEWGTEWPCECLQIVKFLAGAEMLIVWSADMIRLGQGKGVPCGRLDICYVGGEDGQSSPGHCWWSPE